MNLFGAGRSGNSRNAAASFVVIAATLIAALSVIALAAFAATPRVGEKAPDFTLNALDGGKVQLSQVTKSSPVALVVLRGFPGYQCPLCNRQVAELIGASSKFAAAKAQVILVYPGPADNLKAHASEFVTGKTMPKNYRVVLDPDYAFVNKYGLRWNAPNETAYPSSFVIDRTGKIVFAKISQQHGDRAKSSDLLAAMPK